MTAVHSIGLPPYTALAVVAVLAVLVADRWVLATRLITRVEFWLAYPIVVVFQLLSNGWLTGREIVRYDPEVILGGAHPELFGSWRVGYAPVEDLMFGFALVLWTWMCWERLAERAAGQERRARR